MQGHVDRDRVGGVAWLAARGDSVERGTAGVLTRGSPEPIRRDSIFRIASMTKPIVAVAALVLVEECKLRLEDPVDELLPELAERRVLVDGRGALDGDTVPARRPITVHDVLTFQLGLEAFATLGLGAGPPQPQVPPGPDEWMRRLETLPLLYQPGDHWLYDIGSDVLGVLVARAAGQPLEDFLRARVFEPLRMIDTGFSTTHVDRLGSCYTADETGGCQVFDPPSGQWTTPPAFPSGRGGLLSTLDDMHTFGRMLLSGGRLPDGSCLLSRASVDAMTIDQLDIERRGGGPSPDGSLGWGFGVAVQVRRTGLGPTVGSYGWTGGLGTSWGNDPSKDLVGVVLTTDAFVSAFPLPVAIQDFWTSVYAALED